MADPSALSTQPENLVLNDVDKKVITTNTKEVVCGIDIYYLRKLIKGVEEGELFILKSKNEKNTYLAIIPNDKKEKTIKVLALRKPEDEAKDILLE